MLKISNVKVSLKATPKEYAKIIANNLNLREKEISNAKLLKRSVDARKANVMYICSFAFSYKNEDQLLQSNKQVSKYEPYIYPTFEKTNDHVVVVGSGPAGLFCAYVLARSGNQVTLIEQGQPIEKRIEAIDKFSQEGILNPLSNIQFGEGGAGTFSDGKLSTGIKDKRISFVLETFVRYGANEDILYEALPHVGTDYLRTSIVNMRNDIIKMGGKVLFDTKMTKLLIKENQCVGIEINHQDIIEADHVVLAIGHSARDTFEMLYDTGIEMVQKPFAVGFRIEHLAKDVNESQYKKAASLLKPASYKASYHAKNGKGVYTFCMCPGGYVMPSASEEGMVVTNGMSYQAREGINSNSAVLVNVDSTDFKSDHPLAGMYFQRDLERKAFALGGSNYHAPCQLVKDYIENKPSTAFGKIQPTYKPGVTLTNLNVLFNKQMNQALKEGLKDFKGKLSFFKDEDAVLTGVESRSSSPVRFIRDDKYMSSLKNLYPCGEGAGMAGGIVSAAIDGMKIAEFILENNK